MIELYEEQFYIKELKNSNTCLVKEKDKNKSI